MLAQVVSTNGLRLEAVILVAGRTLCVMDEFSSTDDARPVAGKEIDVDLSGFLDDSESWDDIFSGNPDQRMAVEPISGWSYRVYGRIVGVRPVRVDCGLFVQEGIISAADERVVGEFVGFTIARLDATRVDEGRLGHNK